MAAAFTIIARDLAPFQARLAELLERSGDLSPLMDRIGQALESSTVQRFEDEEAPDGSRWEPSLRAKETGGKTLTLSARLKQSITHRASATQVEIGTNVIYAGVHQGGATIRGNPLLKFKLPGGLGFRSAAEVVIPARPFLGVSADDQDEIEALVEEYLLEGAE